MNIKPLIKPPISDTFNYGYIESWNICPSIRKDRSKYNYKISLNFSSGKKISFRKGGFTTKKAALKSRELTITQLNSNTFIPFLYTVEEFYTYWLYYYMIDVRQISYGTYEGYRNIIFNYIVPKYGVEKMIDINLDHIVNILVSLKTPSLVRSGQGMLGSSFKTAIAMNVVNTNPVKPAIAMYKEMKRKETMYKIRNGEAEYPKKKRFIMPDLKQICYLLVTCKEKYPQMFLPLLFSFSLGTRISETLGLKYGDVDFTNKEIYISRQIGRSLNNEGLYDGTACVQSLRTKTQASVRKIPAPDFLIDEIILARAKYEEINKEDAFHDDDYICCKENGIPFHRSSFKKSFKELLAECNVSPFRWHDIRHIYATYLKDNSISMKAISSALGHTTERITEEVYIEKKETRFDSTALNAFIEEIYPKGQLYVKQNSPIGYTDCKASLSGDIDDYYTDIFPDRVV